VPVVGVILGTLPLSVRAIASFSGFGLLDAFSITNLFMTPFYSVDITVSGQLLLSLLFKKVFEQRLAFIYQSRMRLMALTLLKMGRVPIIINDSFPGI